MIKDVIPVLIFIVFTFLSGYKIGSDMNQRTHEKQQAKLNIQIEDLREEYRKKREEHQKTQSELLSEMEKLQNEHKTVVSSLRLTFDDRLLESEKRSSIYRARAEHAGTECRSLAEHTSRLDRSLTEGRELVKEFREDLKQCRLMSEHLIDLIENDRNHFDGNR